MDGTKPHANIKVVKKFNPADIAGSKDVFADHAVFHYYNPKFPDIQGDYIGMAGIQEFFDTIKTLSSGTFQVHPISSEPVGDELVVTHARNTLTLEEEGTIEIDVVIVWRILEGRIAEVWDIPSVFNTVSDTTGNHATE